MQSRPGFVAQVLAARIESIQDRVRNLFFPKHEMRIDLLAVNALGDEFFYRSRRAKA